MDESIEDEMGHDLERGFLALGEATLIGYLILMVLFFSWL